MTKPDHSEPTETRDAQPFRKKLAELEQALDISRKRGQELTELLQDSAVGVYRTTVDGRVLFVNPPMRQIIDAPADLPVDKISARSIYKDPGDRDRLIQLLQKQGRADEFESKMISLAGRVVTVLIYARLIGDEIVGTMVDISSRLEAEKAQLASETAYRELVEHINDAIYTLDENGLITYVTPVSEQILGFTPRELVGMSYQELVHPEDASAVMKAFQDVMAGQLYASEFRLRTKSGEYRWVRSSSQRIIRDGAVKGIRGVVTDISERKQAEEALRHSEELYRTLVDNIKMGIVLIDRSHRVVMTNTTQETHFRKPERGAFVGKECFREFEGRDGVCPHCPGVLAMADGKVHTAEVTGTREDGSQFPALVHAFPVSGLGGVNEGFIEVVEYIEERKAAEAALKENEERLRLLSNLSFEGVALVGDGRILDANGTFAAMFGYAAADVVGRVMSDLVTPEYRDSVEEKLTFRDEKDFEVVGRRTDGSSFAMELSLKTTTYKGRRCRYVSARDVTARKKLERHLVMVASRERMRMRMQLHDGVCQQLSGIGMVAKALSGDLSTKSRAEAATAESIVKMLSVVIDQARSLAKDLQPIAQDPSALAIGLDELVRRTGKIVKADCVFSANMKIELRDHEAASQLYLIGQEALSNAVRHSGAKRIQVSLSRTDDVLVLRVEDNGKGLAAGWDGKPSVAPGSGDSGEPSARMGLDIMRYRAGLIGAALRIEPGRDGGTVVECEWKGR